MIWKFGSLGQIHNPNEFLVCREIQGAKEGVIYLIYTNSREVNQRDSCRLKDGRVYFRGNIAEPTFGFMKMDLELEASVKISNYDREVKEFPDGLDADSEGRPAYDSSSEEYQSKALTLLDFSGKYILLDFRGAGVPCRPSSPNLVELFRKYSSKGLTKIGIAVKYDSTSTK